MNAKEDIPPAECITWKILKNGAMSLYHEGQRLLRSWNLAHKGQPDCSVLTVLYDSAVLLAKKALEVAEKEVGSGHPRVAMSIDTLGLIYMAQGRLAEAVSLYKRSLSIWENYRGMDHPDVGYALNNLALAYYKQKRYPEAEPFFKRALAIWEKTLLSNGPDVEPVGGLDLEDTVHSLAYIYSFLGQFAGVESVYKRKLALWEKILGPDHPELIVTLVNLAELYRKTGRAKKGKLLEERIARIRAITHGPPLD